MPGIPEGISGGGQAMKTADAKNPYATDNTPESKAMFQELFQQAFLTPGMGLGTPTWDPHAGLVRQQRRRMAQGASAQERMRLFQYAGATDRDGMVKVFRRAYAPPERAFMLGREGK
jgi:hypothetical protein